VVAVSSWGRLTQASHNLAWLDHPDFREGTPLPLPPGPGIAHGMGRSYGDACLNPDGVLWMTRRLDRFIRFDDQDGTLQCEAGVLLRDIQRLAVPRGWMLPVTPGSQLVTVGGAIANDVHGKNHHVAGSFGDHVLELVLQRSDGEVITCGPGHNRDWFSATVGGIGLTGVVLSARIQLRRVASPWLQSQTIPYRSLDEFFQLADASERDWEHTVSWIDCLAGSGRGLFMRGNHADLRSGPLPASRGRSVPFVPPVSLVNPLSLRAFNTMYFHLGRLKAGTAVSHYEPFFYPLDNLQDWNRIYGPKGFFQYQCAVPRAHGQAAIAAMLRETSHSGMGSFLAVLKTFGQRSSTGWLGFPSPGVTLALDFPNQGAASERLFRSLDAIVAQSGGRIYLAKDARMPASLFRSGYPNAERLSKYRDPLTSSAMSRRLLDH
jgi:FAD/FMN-containing dehydrogenase